MHSSTFNSTYISTIIQRSDQVNTDLSPSFISQYFQSLCTLEQWAWTIEEIYLQFFRAQRLFNVNLIIQYDQIEADTKGTLSISTETVCIDSIFEAI